MRRPARHACGGLRFGHQGFEDDQRTFRVEIVVGPELSRKNPPRLPLAARSRLIFATRAADHSATLPNVRLPLCCPSLPSLPANRARDGLVLKI
jgi:hypothetical protein